MRRSTITINHGTSLTLAQGIKFEWSSQPEPSIFNKCSLTKQIISLWSLLFGSLIIYCSFQYFSLRILAIAWFCCSSLERHWWSLCHWSWMGLTAGGSAGFCNMLRKIKKTGNFLKRKLWIQYLLLPINCFSQYYFSSKVLKQLSFTMLKFVNYFFNSLTNNKISWTITSQKEQINQNKSY